MAQRALVIGGRGTLGSLIRNALADTGQFEVFSGTRTPSRADDAYIDADDRESIASALETLKPSLMIVAVPSKDPVIQMMCAAQGVPCIDVSPQSTLRNMAESQLLSTDTPIVTMCGFYPGLSGILATEAASSLDETYEIHVGLLQSTNAAVGQSGVKDMLQMLTRPVRTPHGESPGFTLKRSLTFGAEQVVVRQMRYEEEDALKYMLPEVHIAYYTAWPSKAFTALVSSLNRMRLLQRFAHSKLLITPRHNPTRPETVYLTVEAEGTSNGQLVTRHFNIQAESDYRATADVATAIALVLMEEPDRFRGVNTPMETVGLEDIRSNLRHVTNIVEPGQ